MIRPLKMRLILTCAAAVVLLAITPACAQDYEATRHAAEQGDALILPGKSGQVDYAAR